WPTEGSWARRFSSTKFRSASACCAASRSDYGATHFPDSVWRADTGGRDRAQPKSSDGAARGWAGVSVADLDDGRDRYREQHHLRNPDGAPAPRALIEQPKQQPDGWRA